MESEYAVWFGQPVILQLSASDLRVPLRGIIVAETDNCVRFQVEQTWEIDIFKNMILSVEQDRCAWILVN